MFGHEHVLPDMRCDELAIGAAFLGAGIVGAARFADLSAKWQPLPIARGPGDQLTSFDLFQRKLEMSVELAETPKRRDRGGRESRRQLRTQRPAGVHRPYIVRTIPTYDVLSEENLIRIEQTADRILAEIGIEFRDDPMAIAHWKKAGAQVDGVLVRFEPGMLREVLKTAP
jgi:hypothetical protein